jgi:CTP synthase (UTP-ammonia lyase)
MASRDLRDPAKDLVNASGIWVVPASPYENTAGVLAAIRWVRETKRPFLGTCGGFQHAMIEYARNVLGLPDADHAETNPAGSQLVVHQLACSLDQSALLHLVPKSRLHRIYGRDTAQETYRCSFGLNVSFRQQFERAGMQFTAFDESGDPRAAELPASIHPFIIGTLFQPERTALRGETPPLARAFVQAAVAFNP